jgi:hypothetical protein
LPIQKVIANFVKNAAKLGLVKGSFTSVTKSDWLLRPYVNITQFGKTIDACKANTSADENAFTHPGGFPENGKQTVLILAYIC